jgi:hypothetical protein
MKHADYVANMRRKYPEIDKHFARNVWRLKHSTARFLARRERLAVQREKFQLNQKKAK